MTARSPTRATAAPRSRSGVCTEGWGCRRRRSRSAPCCWRWSSRSCRAGATSSPWPRSARRSSSPSSWASPTGSTSTSRGSSRSCWSPCSAATGSRRRRVHPRGRPRTKSAPPSRHDPAGPGRGHRRLRRRRGAGDHGRADERRGHHRPADLPRHRGGARSPRVAVRARPDRVPAGCPRADVARGADRRFRRDVRPPDAGRRPVDILGHGSAVRGRRRLGADRGGGGPSLARRRGGRARARTLPLGAPARPPFDAWPAAMTMAALLALAYDRPRLGLGLLGLGAATKLFPALLVPMTLVWLVARGERRAAWQGAAVFAAVVAIVALPVAPHGLGRVVSFHLDRPVQIESTPATVLFAVDESTVIGTAGHPDPFKSQGLVGAPADAVADVFAVLSVLCIAVVAVAARLRTDVRRLVLCAFATLLAFVAFGKVLSPQFLLWLVPFAAIAWARREWATAVATTAAVVATQLEFPSRYWDLVAGDTGPVVLVGLRNALLLVALTSLLVQLAAPARWRRPAPAATR